MKLRFEFSTKSIFLPFYFYYDVSNWCLSHKDAATHLGIPTQHSNLNDMQTLYGFYSTFFSTATVTVEFLNWIKCEALCCDIIRRIRYYSFILLKCLILIFYLFSIIDYNTQNIKIPQISKTGNNFFQNISKNKNYFVTEDFVCVKHFNTTRKQRFSWEIRVKLLPTLNTFLNCKCYVLTLKD